MRALLRTLFLRYEYFVKYGMIRMALRATGLSVLIELRSLRLAKPKIVAIASIGQFVSINASPSGKLKNAQ